MSLFTKIKGGIRFAIAGQANKRFTDTSLSGNLNAELFQFGQVREALPCLVVLAQVVREGWV